VWLRGIAGRESIPRRGPGTPAESSLLADDWLDNHRAVPLFKGFRANSGKQPGDRNGKTLVFGRSKSTVRPILLGAVTATHGRGVPTIKVQRQEFDAIKLVSMQPANLAQSLQADLVWFEFNDPRRLVFPVNRGIAWGDCVS
jgi:hypothetical protein